MARAIYYDAADIDKVVALYDPPGSHDSSWPGMTKTTTATGSFVSGVPIRHHKIVADVITEMTQGEKDARPLPIPSPLVPRTFVGFGVTWLSTSQVQVKKGVASDSTGRSFIEVSGTLTADLLTSGAGGLDTGTEQDDTSYALFVIWGPGVTTTALLSLSATAPTLPTGYVYFRRIWWVRSGSNSDLWDFEQIGSGPQRRCWWKEPNATLQALSNGQATGYTVLDLSNFMPPTSQALVGLVRFKTGTAGAGSDNAKFRINGATSMTIPVGFGVVSDDKGRVPMEMATDASQKLEYKVNLGGTNGNRTDLLVMAWDDEL